MKILELRDLFERSKSNTNYQFRDLSDEEFAAKAQLSFSKLTEAQRRKTTESWIATLIKNGVDTSNPTSLAQEAMKYRFMAQTNLFFLCHLLETYNKTTVGTHEEICNKFFVQKDPTFPSFERFANQYSDLKNRMLLVPRGGFKSSIDIADCVQWITCFPAITILILTGVYKLASDFVGELRGHFTFEDTDALDLKGKPVPGPKQMYNEDTLEWSDNMFQVLFPEHCIPTGDGTQFEYQSPAGGNEKEPSVRAASIEQSLVGQHFGIMKLDDVVTNENSQTVDRLSKVNKQISINRAMLHPYGFMDVIGTWYDEKDYYGSTIKNEETIAQEDGMVGAIQGTVDSGRFNSEVHTKIYLRAAWWFNQKAITEGRVEAEAKHDDYELWFPERLTYDFLSREKRNEKSEGGFEIKYLNNPRKINRIKFPRELLTRRTITHTQLPPQGVVVTTIDTAYSTKSWADYTVILTSLIYGGRFYIINMKRGRYSEFELPAVIADVANTWKPKRIAIEESIGVKWMGRELRREMDKRQISVPVEYVSLGLGSKSRSKAMKAKPVLRLLGDERMFFLNSCEGLNEIYTELEQFTGTSDDAHDDIVSAISILAEQFGAYAEMGAKVDKANSNYVSDRQNYERHQLVHGLGKYTKYNASQMTNDDNPKTAFQMENSRAFRDDTEMGRDPLSDAGLFG